jgi:ligand-binding sensor domain-containing protein/serine phosphatase RsbU (regulator of sigma subunit)
MSGKNIIQSIVFFFPFVFAAQTYHFANYGVKNGLAQSNVSGIIQDSAGFYWLATDGGASRFDGRNFVNYTTEHGLADNNVSAIFLDRDHNIWMGHENGLLTKYDGVNFTQIKSRLLPKDKKIYGFYQDQAGSLWVCTATGGVIRIMDPSRDISEKVQLQIKVYSGRDGLSQYVFSASEDKQGNLWFLTDIGIKILNKTTREFSFFRPMGMPVGQISCLARDRKGNFLMGTTNGSVSRYNTSSGKFETLINGNSYNAGQQSAGPNFIYAILEDNKGNVWASGSNYGVYRYEPVSGKITLFNTTNGLSVSKIKTIYQDHEGNILFGTSGEGLEVFSSERFVSYSKRNGLLDNQIWAIQKDSEGNMWFGSNEGITIMNPNAPPEKMYRHLTVAQGLPSNNIRALASDRKGNIWIGMWGGKVARYDISSGRIVLVPELNEIVNTLVCCLLVDSKDFLWIGTLEGIVRYDLNSQAIRTFRTIDGLSDNDISCIYEDNKGYIWIGTKQKGVTIFNGKTFRKYSRQSGLSNGSISSITGDSKNNIWFGTEGGGVFVYNGRTFTNYRSRNGLISDFITLIARDKKNNMWLGTNKGLSRFNPENSTFTTYRESDGFTGVETKPRSVFVDDGAMWFGTVNGAFKYNPKLDVAVKSPPVTRLLQFKVNLKDYSLNGKQTLSYKDNSLSFEYIGISLSNPQSVRYKVKLEGYDEDWKPLTDETSVVYSNLSPGKYTYKLVACNGSGICAEPVTMKIVIEPPYWKTWWFYLIVLTAVTAALFAYIKIRERKLRHEKKVLEDKVNERTAEVVEKNKELDEINKDITASIRYAKRIQDAILPPDDYVKKHLPETFILFKPKDIVSGDFYWMEEKTETVIFAAVDCTGHGVPGAFMSIVGHNLLDRVVGEQKITRPARILDELNKSISDTLRQTDLEDNTVRDGMDIALCALNKKTNVLEFAGAYNPLWLLRDNEIIEIKANKFPIGNSKFGDNHHFTNHEIPLQKGDTIYIFSDGYSDQFGGPKGKKFKASALKQLLLNAQGLNMAAQRELLDTTIEAWRGNHEQVDDILVIGFRYN